MAFTSFSPKNKQRDRITRSEITEMSRANKHRARSLKCQIEKHFPSIIVSLAEGLSTVCWFTLKRETNESKNVLSGFRKLKSS